MLISSSYHTIKKDKYINISKLDTSDEKLISECKQERRKTILDVYKKREVGEEEEKEREDNAYREAKREREICIGVVTNVRREKKKCTIVDCHTPG